MVDTYNVKRITAADIESKSNLDAITNTGMATDTGQGEGDLQERLAQRGWGGGGGGGETALMDSHEKCMRHCSPGVWLGFISINLHGRFS